MEEESKILQRIGLTEYESRIMAALFARSETTALEIAEISGVPITKLYSVLKALENRGFVKTTLSRPKMFRPVDPSAVVDSVLSMKQEKLKEVVSERDSIISTLNSLYDKSGKKYETPKNVVWLLGDIKTQYYEGLKLVNSAKKNIYLATIPEDLKLASSDIVMMNAWMNAVLKRGVIGKEIEPHLKIEERRRILNKLISSFKIKKEKLEFIKNQLLYDIKYETREIQKGKEIYFSMLIKDTDTAIIAFRHPIKLMSHSSIIITDEKVVGGMIDYFNSLWNISKPETSWKELLLEARRNLGS